MADIRQSGLVDDFDRPAPENPAALPWKRDFATWIDTQISGGSMGGTGFPPTGAQMYYSTFSLSGDTAGFETWGLATGSAALSDAWRFGLLTSGDAPDGYLMVMGQGISGVFWDLRRYDNGTFTSIGGSGTGLPGAQHCLMRCARGTVDVWMDDGTGENWSLITSVADNTYRNDLYMHYGVTGIQTGWGYIGGGPIVKTQIYRYVSN